MCGRLFIFILAARAVEQPFPLHIHKNLFSCVCSVTLPEQGK
ncbi:hypothetical protein BN135_816 [Cronobacter muytjensii 530]